MICPNCKKEIYSADVVNTFKASVTIAHIKYAVFGIECEDYIAYLCPDCKFDITEELNKCGNL